MNAGAEVGYQQELGDAPILGHVQRHDIPRQFHLLTVERFDHRLGGRLLGGSRPRFGRQCIGQLRHVVHGHGWGRWRSIRGYQIGPLQLAHLGRREGYEQGEQRSGEQAWHGVPHSRIDRPSASDWRYARQAGTAPISRPASRIAPSSDHS